MIRKTRLLAGLMATVLLSTTCLGGVSAAGDEGITTLNASTSEDESTTWNATVTAGETLFPEGTELRFAVTDEEIKAAVQEQLMTENAEEEENAEEDTTAGKTLQDLHVYDFSLIDAEEAEIDYTDKVTYSVKSSSAADTDTDAADYVIYRVIENEDSGEGAAVTLEPIKNSTGTVKLDESGWMTEFSVDTEPVERIAVAVYKTDAAETDESSEEKDGTEDAAGSSGSVGTYAVNYQQYVQELTEGNNIVDKDSYAPMNRLQILNNMAGASVTVIGSGDGVDVDESGGKQIKYITSDMEENTDGSTVTTAFSNGDFWGETTSGVGANDGIYNEMKVGSTAANTTAPGGVSVLFKGSDPNAAGDYEWGYRVGWNSEDQDITKTSMWVKLLYKNVGYYDGELINAEATIHVTPSKNRNPDTAWYDSYNAKPGYHGVYHPMFQASGSLYRGWVWQNVEEFHVDLQFFKATDVNRTAPIVVGVDNAEETDYNSMYADYYTINSLNPQRWSGESPSRATGPEYVAPTQNIAHAYIVGEYEIDGKTYSSNISHEYVSRDANGNKFIQYAYNGGSNPWENNDFIGAPGYAQNSVMIMPIKTKTLSFSMGQLELQPWAYAQDATTGGYTQATAVMWASISTAPFTNERQPIDIDVTKEWDGLTSSEKSLIRSVDLQLWGEYTNTHGDSTEELIDEITITSDNDWKGTFSQVPGLTYYNEANGYQDFKYVVREVQVSYTNGSTDVYGTTGFPYEVTFSDPISSTSPDPTTDYPYDIIQEFTIKNTKSPQGSVTVIKQDTSSGLMADVTFQLQATNDQWQPITDTLDAGYYNQTHITAASGSNFGKVVFKNLKPGKYLLTETKTQSGYTLLKDPVQITIPYTMSSKGSTGPVSDVKDGVQGENGEIYYYNLTYTITNGQSFDLPQTGGTSADRIMRTGMVLFATAAGALLYLNRKRRREQQKN